MEQIKNEKTFFHVFPTLKVEEEFKVLFADVEVKKITTNSGRDFLHVHLKSHHLIPKKKIWQMEQRIKEQLFGTSSVKLQILEEYELSELYTPETVMEEYKESLILELKEISVLAANMFSQAEVNYEEGNVVRLELLDTIVSEGRKEEIMNLLDNVFRNRFHMNVDIRVTYKENEGQGSREYDEQRIQQEINAIFERRAKQRGEYEERKSAVEAKKKSSESGSYVFRKKRKQRLQGKNFFKEMQQLSGGKKEFEKEGIPQEGLCASGEDRRRSEPDLRKEFEDEPIKIGTGCF